jgi:hypothetical protein
VFCGIWRPAFGAAKKQKDPDSFAAQILVTERFSAAQNLTASGAEVNPAADDRFLTGKRADLPGHGVAR